MTLPGRESSGGGHDRDAAGGPAGQIVHIAPPAAGDERLVESIARGSLAGSAQLFDRYAPHVRGVLVRLLGVDGELDDLLQDVFLSVVEGLPRLREPEKLKGFVTQIAVHTAHGRIRWRTRRRWLSFGNAADVPQPVAHGADAVVREALFATYRVLEAMPAGERVVFTLRFIEGMELLDVADACAISLATVKRRLGRAEKLFVARARGSAVLRDWLEGGQRWSET